VISPRGGDILSNARRFAGNSLALTIASLSAVLLGAIYRIFIARYIGEVEFGKYIFIITYISYFSIISQLGLRPVIVREVATHPERHRSITIESLKIRIPSTALALSLAYLLVSLLGKGRDIRIGLLIYGASLFAMTLMDNAEGMLVGRESSVYITISSLISNLLKLSAGVFMLRHGAGLIAVLSLFTFISVLNAGISWAAYRWAFRSVKPLSQTDGIEARRFLLKESWPFFWLMLIGKVYYKNDIMILSLMKGDLATGRYGAAYQPIDALTIVASSLTAAAYPIMSRLSAGQGKQLVVFHNTLSRYMMLLFQFIAVVLTAVGPELIRFLFGARYSAAAPVLRLLAWVPVADAVTILMGNLLAATSNQRLLVRIAMVSASMNLALCLSLIPHFGYMGAAYGTVVSGYLNMLYVMYIVNRKIHRIDWANILLKPAVCAVCALVVLFGVSPIAGRYVGLVAAVVAYLLAIGLTKTLGMDDFHMVRTIFEKSPVEAG
jgi:O-antigen/teichoic acid export membrane protein